VPCALKSQGLSNWRSTVILSSSDTVRVDTLSMIPGSLSVIDDMGEKLNYDQYYLNEIQSRFALIKDIQSDSIRLNYRVFASDLSQSVYNKDTLIIQKSLFVDNPFAYKVTKENTLKIFDESSLERNGSISRGLVVGNRQNLSVNSDFNLQLSGKISDQIGILANISDDNIPIQAEGNTQQLQEFDNIFIKLFDEKSNLIAGDFRTEYGDGRFMRYAKKARGVDYRYMDELSSNKDSVVTLNIGASIAVSKGKFGRNTFMGIEGNQGPYRLTGAENELFIIVLAGTERVFVDGVLKKRGADGDYVIDYNSSEITFTSNLLVTKDVRINIDFQYSDKNYTRSVVTTNASLQREKSKLSFHFYSEQDSKNQPLQQDLSEEERQLLSIVGDNLDQAVILGVDSAAFSDSEVLYQLTDSLGYDSVFVYRPDPDSTNYRLNFSLVGENNGDYVQDGFTPNGRKFRWISPDTINGGIIRQGDYLPVRRLISPQKRMLLITRYEKYLENNDMLYVEGSLSNRDLNNFSDNDDQNNLGAAVNFGGIKSFPLNERTKLQLIVDHEYRDKDFQSIERYREVEFDINWNYQASEVIGDQHLSTIGLGIVKDQKNYFNWKLNSLLEDENYNGIKNEYNLFWKKKSIELLSKASLLKTSGNEKTSFIVQSADLSKRFAWWKIGVKNEFRSNKKFLVNQDSLMTSSFEFIDGEIYIANHDSSDHNFRLFYKERLDKLSDQVDLRNSSNGKSYGVQYQGRLHKNHQLDAVVSNRTLRIINEELTDQKAEDTFLGKLNYTGRVLKKAMSFNTFYDISSGLEPQKEFLYIQVPAGQGVYVWVDYNENGVKELEEFEIAKFQYEADYIRTFTLTNDFQKTFANSFSQSLDVNPAIWWYDSTGFLKFISRFSNLTSIRISRKTTREDNNSSFDPFIRSIDNNDLINLNSSLREVLFFNKNNLKWGMDFTYTELANKQLLSNGFEARRNDAQRINLRWNINRAIRWDQSIENGNKVNAADYSQTRDYAINYRTVESTIQYQPGKKYRVKLNADITAKENNNAEQENEKANLQSIGLEGRFSEVNKGNLQLGFDFINIDFTGGGNNSLSFEMLNGLAVGKNYTWNILLQRTIMKNLELNFTYNGRKSESINAIHSGGMQIRAFF
jgi:hypothetical protein